MLFVRLDVNYQDDDKILEVSAEAELLYVRGLALAKRMGTDGYLSRSHLRRIADKLTAPVDGLVAELVDIGLWSPAGDRWLIEAWFKHNQPLDDLTERKRRGGALGAHRRWGHDEPFDTCSKCTDRTPDGTPIAQPMAQPMAVDGSSSSRDRVETETHTQTPARTRATQPKTLPPPDWQPTDSHRQLADTHHRDLDVETQRFIDYCHANNKRYADIDRAFNNWLRNDQYRSPPNGQPRYTATEQRTQRSKQARHRALGELEQKGMT